MFLDKALINLTLLELDGMATVEEVCIVLQKFEMFRRIKMRLQKGFMTWK